MCETHGQRPEYAKDGEHVRTPAGPSGVGMQSQRLLGGPGGRPACPARPGTSLPTGPLGPASLVTTGDLRPNRDCRLSGAIQGQSGRLTPGDVKAFKLRKWELQDRARHLLPENGSLAKCYRTPRQAGIEVHRSASRGTASYRGLCTCQSATACPVCSARLGAYRSAELTQIIEAHRALGGTVALVTFTAAHTREETLDYLAARMNRAQRRFTARRDVKEALTAAGYVGRVSSLEVTYGNANGWHPHYHVLLFIDAGADLDHLANVMRDAWMSCLHKETLQALPQRAFDLRGGEQAGAYVSKLGMEVALAVCKKGRSPGRFGVWELLANDEAWSDAKYCEYARYMKGKHTLRYSKGLKKRYQVEEVTDAEIMELDGEADEVLVCVISKRMWSAICRSHSRGQVLEQLANIGPDTVQHLEAFALVLGEPPGGFAWADLEEAA